MSKTKAKKVAKPEEKVKGKEPVERKQGDAHDSAEVKPPPAPAAWSDWIWDEALKLYYRAKRGKGDQWTYEYFEPEVHPATKRVASAFVPEKFDYPRVEEKVIYAAPEYRFEVPNTRGSDYLVSVREEMRAGGGAGAEAGKFASGKGEPAGDKAAVKGEPVRKVEGGKEGKAKAGPNVRVERVYEWRDQVNDALQLEKSVDNQEETVTVKQQPQRDGKPRNKDREKHHDKKESRHKERRK